MIGLNAVFQGKEIQWIIYSFHMPAFILISGYFSKKESWKQTIKKIILYLLVPFLFFQVFYQFLFTTQFDYPLNFDLAKPHYTLWFLLSLACWRVMLQLVTRFKGWLLLFIILWLGHRFWIDDLRFLSLGRTLSFMPFFFIGYYLKTYKGALDKQRIFIWLSNFRFLMGALGILIFCSLFYFDAVEIPRMWFDGIANYAVYDAQHSTLYLVLYQLYAFLFSLLMVSFFMMLVTKKPTIWTHFGKTSMSIYLFHGLLIQLMRSNDWMLIDASIVSLFITSVLSFTIVSLLSQPIFQQWIDTFTRLKKPS